MKFYKAVLVILIVPLLIGISCGLKKKETPAEEEITATPAEELPFTSQEVADNSTQFIDRLADAEARARKDFVSDAYLFNVKVTLPATLNPQGAVEEFLFASPTKGDYIYQAIFSVSKNTVQRGYLYTRDFLKNHPPAGGQKLPSLNSINVKHGYLKAIEAAETGGSKDLRKDNPIDGVIATLKQGSTLEAVTWQVDYQGKTETQSFEVDARTGELLPVSSAGEPAETPPETTPQETQTQPSTTSPAGGTTSPTTPFTTEASGT